MSNLPFTLTLMDDDGTVRGKWSTEHAIDRRCVFRPLMKNLEEIALQDFSIKSIDDVLKRYKEEK